METVTLDITQVVVATNVFIPVFVRILSNLLGALLMFRVAELVLDSIRTRFDRVEFKRNEND
jgi:hypothetical protein